MRVCRKFREDKDAKADFMLRVSAINRTALKIKHWFFFGDRKREITEDETLKDEQEAKDSAIRNRKERHKYNPFQIVQGKVERSVGPCTTQIFLFYQVCAAVDTSCQCLPTCIRIRSSSW